MRVALYQCPPLPLDVSGNLTRLEQQAQAAAKQGAQVLICPEMFLSGYNIGAQAVGELAQAQDGPAATRIAAIAQASGIAILYGYPERAGDGQIYNAVQLIDSQGTRLCNYRKTHLFSELDKSMFVAGDDHYPVVELNGWRLGLLICYDVEFPENTRRLALAGAELILVPTANMLPYDFVCDVTVRARAFENHCYVVYANYCGSEGAIRYCGLSSICAPDGSRPLLAGQDEALLVGTLDKILLAQARTANDYFVDRRPALYTSLT
ncbi:MULTISPECIES: carbon-nitrogen hydrolase family protein [Pseudomonas]|uniref:Carbon-nitrogen hydrolase family protein n=2 Tax=Pseudomonas fragariae (ex Marin et al. 2024) TaxID=3080056 RepID=A0ABU5B5S9_9PSED|nr:MULTISPECIES: carbon-nitrogen hydrolase family protein [Pseudomonas]MCW6058367.1 carbon-nitrogen hydrolase family protein [Pseudomonas fragi]MCA5974425.1 carbon-nitrogen hydrolase family protein [Pseudomonas sp. P135]MCH5536533.1 carbon-nitrogen hydrolase family protein [Pseudomonas syringae pv. syringae]MCH5570889.1 carbon-nitrogen hydrolase family protein [Pseudomonas syringae pv. syringae]MDV0428465.1 carbon-nitrogen hydrolase family protein [Pseudomonas sp. 17]